MVKKIFGWVCVVLGLVGALCGVLMMLGGAGFWVMLRMLFIGITLASIGWRMRANNQ